MQSSESEKRNGAVAMWLALAGFIPFAALAVWLYGIDIDHPWREMTIELLKTYGAVILSFLGGIRWGIATARNDARTPSVLVLSVVPSLVGWACIFLPEPYSFAVLALSFAAQGAWDQFSIVPNGLPDWFARLRMRLTLLVVLALLIGFAATATSSA